MPVDTRISVPFLPQESITGQILQAIQLANEHHNQYIQQQAQQQQLGIQQQQANTQQAAQQSTAGLQTAQTADVQQQVQQREFQNQMLRRQMEYVFGTGTGGGTQPEQEGQTGPAQQKPGLVADAQGIKKRLKLSDEESAAFDQALKSVQVGFLSSGKLDMGPVDKMIEAHLKEPLHPTLRNDGKQWFQDMHTKDGKLAYSVPIPPPSEYLAHATEGTDYLRTVDGQTGAVTITPISTNKVTKPILPGQPMPNMSGNPAPVATNPVPPGATSSSPTPLKSFQLPGAGKKLSEAGQTMITGLTQATDLVQPAIDFISGKATRSDGSKVPAPSNADWYKAVAMYKLHMDPGPEFANTFQAIGLARAIATGPLLHGIRNQRIIKGIQEHLPDLTDSPALVNQKMKDLQPFWKQAMEEVYKTENVKNPSGISDAASKYLESIGVPH